MKKTICLFSLSWCVHTWRRNIKFLDWEILISNFFLSLFYRFSTSKINPIKGNSRRIVTLEDRNTIDLTKLSRPNGDRSQDVCCNREDSPQKWYHMVGWWRIWIEKKTKITNDLFPKRFVLWNLVIMRFYFPRWFVHYWIQFLQFPSCSPCPVYSSSSSEERPIHRVSVMLEHLQFLFCPRVHWRWIRCLRNMRSPIHTLLLGRNKQSSHSLNTRDGYLTLPARTKVKAECLRARLLMLGYVVLCYFRLFFQ